MTETITADTLTGAQVRALREHYKLSRRELADLAGFPTQTRVVNIEAKDSWKPGNREALITAFTTLAANPPRGARGRRRGETAEQRVDRLQQALAANGHALDEATPAFFDPSVDDLPSDLLVPVNEDDTVAPVATPDGPAADGAAYLLTNSEVATWQRCRRKWWLTWFRRLALRRQDYLGPRAIGNRVHRALAAWYVPEGEVRVDPRDALERAIVEDWTAISTQAREYAVGDVDEALAELSTRFNEAVALERAMIEGYVQWLEQEGVDANLEVTAPESTIKATISGDVAGQPVTTQVLAKLDVRARRVNDGTRIFIDHKSVGNFTDPRKTLHMDPQMLEYHLLEWLSTPAGEAYCDTALYNMLRKVKRSSTAKPPFYERVEVHHNPYELEAYRRRLLGVARDVQRATDELAAGADPLTVVYPNPTRNCSWDCDFFPVCPMFDDGSRVEDALAALYVEVDPNQRYTTEEQGI